jgi:hypothetical protein
LESVIAQTRKNQIRPHPCKNRLNTRSERIKRPRRSKTREKSTTSLAKWRGKYGIKRNRNQLTWIERANVETPKNASSAWKTSTAILIAKLGVLAQEARARNGRPGEIERGNNAEREER